MGALDSAINTQIREVETAQKRLRELYAWDAKLPSLSECEWLSDILPWYIYEYDGRIHLVLQMNFPRDGSIGWRAQAKAIADVRRAFGIKAFMREVTYDGTIAYSGANERFAIELRCSNGGLPPSCKLVAEEVTETVTRKRYRTECE